MELETEFISMTPAVDKAAESIYAEDKDMAVEYLTNYSNSVGDRVFNTWKGLYAYLFMKYMDGNVKTKKEVPEGYLYVNPELEQPGYSEDKYKEIATSTGDKLKVGASSH